MAGFQLSINGRFWVSTEALARAGALAPFAWLVRCAHSRRRWTSPLKFPCTVIRSPLRRLAPCQWRVRCARSPVADGLEAYRFETHSVHQR